MGVCYALHTNCYRYDEKGVNLDIVFFNLFNAIILIESWGEVIKKGYHQNGLRVVCGGGRGCSKGPVLFGGIL